MPAAAARNAAVLVVPAVAMRDLVAAIGTEIAHRSAGRDDDVAGRTFFPSAGIGMNAHARAGRARLRQRQHALDHGAGIVRKARWRLENDGDPGHGLACCVGYAVAARAASAVSRRATFCNSRWLVSLRKKSPNDGFWKYSSVSFS